MRAVQEFLIQIGANSKDFEAGMIAGAIIVMIALFLVLLISTLGKIKKKKTIKKEEKSNDENTIKIKQLEEKIEALNSESALLQEEKFTEGALYSLVLLQREGRFVDFIKENIDVFEDEQIGAAVRQIHTGCKKVLEDNFCIKPLFDKVEGDKITLDDNFDPTEIKMTGNVPGKAPYDGELRHKGWISEKVKLPKRTGKINVKVVCPAEIEF